MKFISNVDYCCDWCGRYVAAGYPACDEQTIFAQGIYHSVKVCSPKCALEYNQNAQFYKDNEFYKYHK